MKPKKTPKKTQNQKKLPAPPACLPPPPPLLHLLCHLYTLPHGLRLLPAFLRQLSRAGQLRVQLPHPSLQLPHSLRRLLQRLQRTAWGGGQNPSIPLLKPWSTVCAVHSQAATWRVPPPPSPESPPLDLGPQKRPYYRDFISENPSYLILADRNIPHAETPAGISVHDLYPRPLQP